MSVGASEIREWHLKRGFNDIGYHHVIRRNGTLEGGRCETVKGAHTRANGGNKNSIGVCWVGTKVITQQQIKALTDLYSGIYYRWDISWEAWHGHCEYDPNNKPDCPGFSMSLIRYILMKHGY
jgi:N-acetyl-anhydromuramyl-L-alanine amidase AmpD